MWGRPSSDCSRKCSRIPAATRATISCPVSNAFGYALVAALGNVVGALAVTRRAARELALIEHFVASGAGAGGLPRRAFHATHPDAALSLRRGDPRGQSGGGHFGARGAAVAHLF